MEDALAPGFVEKLELFEVALLTVMALEDGMELTAAQGDGMVPLVEVDRVDVAAVGVDSLQGMAALEVMS